MPLEQGDYLRTFSFGTVAPVPFHQLDMLYDALASGDNSSHGAAVLRLAPVCFITASLYASGRVIL
jgi:hypothetical protein